MKTATLRRKVIALNLAVGLGLLAMANLSYATSGTEPPAPIDPGVRSGAANAGGALSGLTSSQSDAFSIAQQAFKTVHSVGGTIKNEPGKGLGPSFNGNSCASCHSNPSAGGSSPGANPQISIASMDGATNQIPVFPTFQSQGIELTGVTPLGPNGPVVETRFVLNSDGTPDGSVHDLFTITGRSDAPSGFNLPQTNFAEQVAANNVVFRIPTPLFGDGLIEAIPDSAIVANQQVQIAAAQSFAVPGYIFNLTTPVAVNLGIAGVPNISPTTHAITRFGWKAQNTLLQFSGEASAVELGVTNDLFPQPREDGGLATPSSGGHPEDTVDLATGGISNIDQFLVFMRLLSPPKQVTSGFQAVGSNGTSIVTTSVTSQQIGHGQILFNTVGCAVCHTPTLTTGPSAVSALNKQPVNLFSDLLLHHMGPVDSTGNAEADGVTQGSAQGDMFRTSPLWGCGKRVFFMHDGRITDLEQAIQAHLDSFYSPAAANYLSANPDFVGFPSPSLLPPIQGSLYGYSEADVSISMYNNLSVRDQDNILDFLRSL
jgi:CxxC motif-containing protein (DUF1111 family)